jgi:hypothetical protein
MAVIDAIRPAMKDQTVGNTPVRDVRVETREDSFGEPAMFVVLVLADPPVGADSWPIDDLRAMKHWVRDFLSKLEIDIPWFVVFEPEHQDPDHEQLHLGDLGE